MSYKNKDNQTTPVPQLPKINLFDQVCREFDDYSVRIYESVQDKCSFGVKARFKVPEQLISSFGSVILKVTLPPILGEAGSEACWVPYIGYSMIKSYGCTVSKDLVLSYDKYSAMKMIYNLFKSQDTRDEVFWHAGHRSELVNVSESGDDNIIKQGAELNILLPLPNMNSIPNNVKFSNDIDMSFFVEFESTQSLINHSIKTSLPASLSLTNLCLTFECYYCAALDSRKKFYITEKYFKEEAGNMSISASDIQSLKELSWVCDSEKFTTGCRLTFIPRFNSTAAELINDYVTSILPSLIFVTKDLDGRYSNMNTAVIKKVENYKILVGRTEVTIIVRGIPDDMNVYYNTNIFVKSPDTNPLNNDTNVSEYFDEILCDYYPEIDKLVFNRISHRLTVEIVSTSVKDWVTGPTRISGDNRLTESNKRDFIFKDHFRFGNNLIDNSSISNCNWNIKYDNSVLYAGSSAYTRLLSIVKNGGLLPPYMLNYSFTGTPLLGYKTTSLNLTANKKVSVNATHNNFTTPAEMNNINNNKSKSLLYGVDYIRVDV